VGDEQWQVAGSAAQIYDRHLVPAIFGPWAPRVLDLAAPAAGEQVLDVACGTGVVARLAAERVGAGGRVACLDLNPGMLAVAGSLPAGDAPVGWVQASAGRLPFPDGSFEVVCCQLGLQFFPDRTAALAEMARALVPGGRLAVMVWRSIDHSPGFAVLAAALDRHIGPAAGAVMRAPFGLSDRGDAARPGCRGWVPGGEAEPAGGGGAVRVGPGNGGRLRGWFTAGRLDRGRRAGCAGGVAGRGPGRAGPMAGRGRERRTSDVGRAGGSPG
jgi:SAM-dependent methyltransferase